MLNQRKNGEKRVPGRGNCAKSPRQEGVWMFKEPEEGRVADGHKMKLVG